MSWQIAARGRVADAMVTRPKTHAPESSLEEIRAFFDEEHVHMALIVGADGLLVTTIERADLAGAVPGPVPATADYLLLRHNSTVELVNRAETAGFVRRSPGDVRVVRVDLTRRGDRLVTDLTEAHLAELGHLAAALNELLEESVVATAVFQPEATGEAPPF